MTSTHSFHGVCELDADIPSVWEAKLIGDSSFRKAMQPLLFAVFQLLRPLRIREMGLVDRWVALNMAVVFALDIVILIALGPRAFLYFVASVFFSRMVRDDRNGRPWRMSRFRTSGMIRTQGAST